MSKVAILVHILSFETVEVHQPGKSLLLAVKLNVFVFYSLTGLQYDVVRFLVAYGVLTLVSMAAVSYGWLTYCTFEFNLFHIGSHIISLLDRASQVFRNDKIKNELRSDEVSNSRIKTGKLAVMEKKISGNSVTGNS